MMRKKLKKNRDDQVNFSISFIGLTNLILIIFGNFRRVNIMDHCEEIFGSWIKAQADADEEAPFRSIGGKENLACLHVELTDAKGL